MNSEENFVLASLQEFMKAWASGHQAQLKIECQSGRAWLQLGFQLGHPSSPHHCVSRPHQQSGPLPHQQRRPKGPARSERDRVFRAVCFCDNQQETSAAVAPGQDDVTDSVQMSHPTPPPDRQAGTPPVQTHRHHHPDGQPAAPHHPPHIPQQQVPAVKPADDLRLGVNRASSSSFVSHTSRQFCQNPHPIRNRKIVI